MKLPRAWLTLLAALPAFAATPAVAETADVDASWLVVLQGEVTSVDDGRMTLLADPQAMAFTDRPQRQVQLLDLQHFVEQEWARGGNFLGNPPNASLVDKTNGVIGVIEVDKAVWDAGVLTVSFTGLEGDLPSSGDHIVLTLDSLAGFDMDTGNVYLTAPPRR